MNKLFFKDYQDQKQTIDFIFENENLIVVNKPAHLPVIPDRLGTYNYNLRDLIANFLRKEGKLSDVWVIHRLDTDTTGLVLFARNESYHQLMNTMFENREVEKIYLALVSGKLPSQEGIINKPILKTVRRMAVHEKGKPSITSYKLLEEFDNYSLVQLKPLTGRTHQLRVHLKSINNPLIIDPLYNKKEAFYLSEIKKNFHHKQSDEPRPLCSRLTLHAQRISFIDPLSKQRVEFEADVPKDFMAVLKSLRKYSRHYPEHNPV